MLECWKQVLLFSQETIPSVWPYWLISMLTIVYLDSIHGWKVLRSYVLVTVQRASVAQKVHTTTFTMLCISTWVATWEMWQQPVMIPSSSYIMSILTAFLKRGWGHPMVIFLLTCQRLVVTLDTTSMTSLCPFSHWKLMLTCTIPPLNLVLTTMKCQWLTLELMMERAVKGFRVWRII